MGQGPSVTYRTPGWSSWRNTTELLADDFAQAAASTAATVAGFTKDASGAWKFGKMSTIKFFPTLGGLSVM
jgi:hypothetical protein